MHNIYYGEMVAYGKTLHYNEKVRTVKYTKNDAVEEYKKIREIIELNLDSLFKKRFEDEHLKGFMDYSIVAYPFKSAFLEEYIVQNLWKSQDTALKIFKEGINTFIKKPNKNILLTLLKDHTIDRYLKNVEFLRNQISKQISRMYLQELVASHDSNIIVVVNRFEKEFLYNLNPHVVGFVCRHTEDSDLVKELSNAYEIPIVRTDRTVSSSHAIGIDGINNIMYVDPKEEVVEKLDVLKSKLTFSIGESPKYKSDVIKFYANLVDKRGIDRAKESTWYYGVALFRSEFMFMTKGCLPSKEEQIDMYVYLLNAFKDRLVQIRIPDFSELKTLDYERDVFTEIDMVPDYQRLYFTNIEAIYEASKIVNKKVTIVIPKLRMGQEIDLWKTKIDGYLGINLPESIKPLFGIMMETESSFLYYEDYRHVDSVIFGLNDYLEEAMDKSRFESVDFEDFMLDPWHDIRGAHQFYRRAGIRKFHIVSGNVLKQPELLTKFIKKGFKHFAIPMSYIKIAEEVLFKHESTRGMFKGVHAEREKRKLNK